MVLLTWQTVFAQRRTHRWYQCHWPAVSSAVLRPPLEVRRQSVVFLRPPLLFVYVGGLVYSLNVTSPRNKNRQLFCWFNTHSHSTLDVTQHCSATQPTKQHLDSSFAWMMIFCREENYCIIVLGVFQKTAKIYGWLEYIDHCYNGIISSFLNTFS